MPDYDRLEAHADTGLGAEEYRGPRRFVRITDKTKAPEPKSLAAEGSEASDHNPH